MKIQLQHTQTSILNCSSQLFTLKGFWVVHMHNVHSPWPIWQMSAGILLTGQFRPKVNSGDQHQPVSIVTMSASPQATDSPQTYAVLCLNNGKLKYILLLTLKHGTFPTCVTPLNWAAELLSLISIHVQTWLQIPDKTNTWHDTWYTSLIDDSQTVFSAVSITCVRPEGTCDHSWHALQQGRHQRTPLTVYCVHNTGITNSCTRYSIWLKLIGKRAPQPQR